MAAAAGASCVGGIRFAGGRPIKPLFSHGPIPGYRMILCVILASFLMFADQRMSWMEDVRAHISTVVAPVQWIVSLPARGLSLASLVLSDQTRLVNENRQLRERLLTLSQRVQRMASLSEENTRLRELLKATPRQEIPWITAGLLTLDNDPFLQQMIIDRGQQSGVYSGQPVVDSAGLAGQIISVSRYSSRVLLITDASHSVPVQINRNGLRFIARGAGQPNRLTLDNVPNNTDVREGDLLVTSGLTGRFPEGYPVARVSHIVRNAGTPFASVEVQPIAQLDRSRNFLLLFTHDSLKPTRHRLSQEAVDAALQVARPVRQEARQ
ncbi:rod shape-determining protein MreC [Kushneria indalinina]|uniref:Cell shape-determining protein MreC n=1 Tax=Kushneria indalinina DSM 14324 TaxID=1122140 RepID=A0A3D9E0J0_9GAMM|nr:rod shape-determining protein MreC [Kushneria indalinina]REC96563.1 rod shape-determining protein MreC [Kushneria indalinina DSM 14324]